MIQPHRSRAGALNYIKYCGGARSRTRQVRKPDARRLAGLHKPYAKRVLYDLISEQWLLPPMSEAAQEVPLASGPTVVPEDRVSGKYSAGTSQMLDGVQDDKQDDKHETHI